MSSTARKRPIVISILAVIGFIFSAGQIIMISYPGIQEKSSFYPIIYGLVVALRFTSLIGIWYMKKWGAELFLYSLLIKITVQILFDDFGIFSIFDVVLMAVFTIVFLAFMRKMGRNL